MSPITKIYQLPQTVFTFKELALFFPKVAPANLKRRVNYYVQSEQLLNPTPGVYTKKSFDEMELGNRIFTPSYISFETVMVLEGIIFQFTYAYTLASYITSRKKIGGVEFSYKRIPGFVLTNMAGIVRKDNYFIATKERAFLDMVYKYKNYYFDNFDRLDKNKVFELLPIYSSKILEARVKKYYGN